MTEVPASHAQDALQSPEASPAQLLDKVGWKERRKASEINLRSLVL